MHGRIKAVDNRTNSKGNTPSMEMTKQEKKRDAEQDALNHMLIPSRQVSANAPIDPLNITRGGVLPMHPSFKDATLKLDNSSYYFN